MHGPFGRFAIFDLDRQDKTTPKNRIVVDGQVVILAHTQPFSLKGRLRSLLSDSLPGRIVERALGPNERAFLWFAPANLDTTTLLSTDKKAKIAPPVVAYLRQIAERLMAEVDLATLQQVARDILGVRELDVLSGFLRLPPEWELFDEPAVVEQLEKALRGLAGMTSLGTRELASVLGASVVEVMDRVDELPESIEEPDNRLQSFFRSYISTEYVVKPQYRAASELVADAALVAGVPALADAVSDLPTLWLDGDVPTTSSTLSALCVADLRLTSGDGSMVARIQEPLTSLWEAWPNYQAQILKSWHPTTRDAVAQALEVGGVSELGAICPVPRDRLLALVAKSPHLVAYALNAFGEDPKHPLSWHRRVTPSPNGYQEILQIANYRDAVLVALAAEASGDAGAATAARLQQVSERLSDLANQVEGLITSSLAEVRALGCPDTVASTVERPIRAAVAAMRAATAERLAGNHAAVELMLAALIGANRDASPGTEAEA